MKEYEYGLWIFMLAAFLGFQLIRNVSPLLHTPLMSLTNAISAIAVVGAILITGEKDAPQLSKVLGFIAVRRIYDQPGQRVSDHRPHAEDVQETGRRSAKVMELILPLLYLLAAAGFILALKWMSSPATARRGVIAGEIGMLLAVVGTLLRFEVVEYQWIFIAFFIGSAVGVPLAYLMPMTAVPQRTAISHAFGALASALIGTAEYYRHTPGQITMVALTLEILLGFLTFTASLMAFGKLQEILPTRPITYKGQNIVNLFVFAVRVLLGDCADCVSGADVDVSHLCRSVAAVRSAADRADRRRRYADRHCVAELLRRTVGQRDGLCARQQTADCGRRAGWVFGFHSCR